MKETVVKFNQYNFHHHYDRLIILVLSEKKRYQEKDIGDPTKHLLDIRNDIWDISDLLQSIQHNEIAELENILDFLQKQTRCDLTLKHAPPLQASSISHRNQPHLITKVVLYFVTNLLPDIPLKQDQNLLYMPGEKIHYNHIIKYRTLLQDYGEYGHHIVSALNGIEEERPGSSKHVMDYMKMLYQDTISLLASSISSPESDAPPLIDRIRAHADDILDVIIEKIVQRISQSGNVQDLHVEEIELVSRYMVAHAFTECKILERPMP